MFTVSKSRSPCFRYDISVMDSNFDMDEIAELTLRWSRHSIRYFSKWEVNELHNEAFIIAMKILDAGRYKPERSSIKTFLWHALPLDVRHRYRRMHGERYLTDEDGVRRYQKVEYTGDTLVNKRLDSQHDGRLLTLDPTENSVWSEARILGFTPKEIARRGITYKEQRALSKEFVDEQQSKRSER